MTIAEAGAWAALALCTAAIMSEIRSQTPRRNRPDEFLWRGRLTIMVALWVYLFFAVAHEGGHLHSLREYVP